MSVRRPGLWLFLAVLAIALGFAAYTDHAWEDYYITYRTSKNLIDGHGLVFQPGEKLHTFTSPIGVLLPAVALALTGNTSDVGALWLFRVMSAAALAGAVVLLWSWARQARLLAVAIVLLVGMLALDAKSIDFSINGMETGVLLLFLALAVRTSFAPPTKRAWLPLGIAWGGLMWSRPDSFIYIAALAAGVWLFNDPKISGRSRGQWLRDFLLAGLVCTAIYLPWLIFAWQYYGSPVPNTIVAKGLCRPNRTPAELLAYVKNLPALFADANSAFEAAFLPAYFSAGGWPKLAIRVAQVLAVIASGAWLLPFVRWEARAASLTFFIGGLYLGFYPYFPFPWYLPTVCLFAVIVLAMVLHQVLSLALRHEESSRFAFYARGLRHLAVAGAVLLVVGTASLTIGAARQLEAAQRLVENGNRKQIGLYLRAHAKPGDSVFSEPLGYIGFFSQLKMYDWPGLSSREIVNTRLRRNGTGDWGVLIYELNPTWLVLRPSEAVMLANAHPSLMDRVYRRVEGFKVLDEVRKLGICGRGYLEIDSQFELYHLENYPKYDHSPNYGLAVSPFPALDKNFGGLDYLLVHAPGELRVPIPANARKVTIGFRFDPLSYSEEQKTDGVDLVIEVRTPKGSKIIWTRTLTPAARVEDQGAQQAAVELPAGSDGQELVMWAAHRTNTIRDWICWTPAVFE